ncbi:MAG: hypothetical protein VYB97_09160 [Pseudomonadota bacterium]|nr:hypothetical protein [Pseudomonadota bacterium]
MTDLNKALLLLGFWLQRAAIVLRHPFQQGTLLGSALHHKNVTLGNTD